jgi:Ca2+:H+ antiporter
VTAALRRGSSALAFGWLIAMILVSVKSIVRQADCLAWKFGEPYGTMVLTLAVTSIETPTNAIVMTTGEPNPTLGRDTMFPVIMIVPNGLVDLSLLPGELPPASRSRTCRAPLPTSA